MLNLNNLKSGNKKKSSKRLGRGSSSRGDYSGRGMKGQKARSGVGGLKLKGMKSWLFKVPKRRGFVSPHQSKENINLGDLEKYFSSGDEITPFVLQQKGLIADYRRGVKILGDGKITKKLKVNVQAVSQAAKKAIESAGGSIELIKKTTVKTKTKAEDEVE